mgnify:CR=1 FL=1
MRIVAFNQVRPRLVRQRTEEDFGIPEDVPALGRRGAKALSYLRLLYDELVKYWLYATNMEDLSWRCLNKFHNLRNSYVRVEYLGRGNLPASLVAALQDSLAFFNWLCGTDEGRQNWSEAIHMSVHFSYRLTVYTSEWIKAEGFGLSEPLRYNLVPNIWNTHMVANIGPYAESGEHHGELIYVRNVTDIPRDAYSDDDFYKEHRRPLEGWLTETHRQETIDRYRTQPDTEENEPSYRGPVTRRRRRGP